MEADNTLKQIADVIQREHDKIDTAATEQLAKSPYTPSCHACTQPGCCYQKVNVTLAEAFPVAQQLISDGRATPELLDKLKSEGNLMEGSTMIDWFENERACIFLDADTNHCTIYKQRPFFCRSYFVINPPEECSPESDKLVKIIDFDAFNVAWDANMHRIHLMLELKETKMRILRGVLPRIVWLLLVSMDEEHWTKFIRKQPWPSMNTLIGWADGENPFEGVEPKEKLVQLGKGAR